MHGLPQGTGYYIRHGEIVYCWHDSRTVTVMSTAHPGHCVNNVIRKALDSDTGTCKEIEVPRQFQLKNIRIWVELINPTTIYHTTMCYAGIG